MQMQTLNLNQFDPTEDGAHGRFETECFWREVPSYVRDCAIREIQGRREPAAAPISYAILESPCQKYVLGQRETGWPGLRFSLSESSRTVQSDPMEGPWVLRLGVVQGEDHLGHNLLLEEQINLHPSVCPACLTRKDPKRRTCLVCGAGSEQFKE